jgi:Fic family protein
MAWITDEPEDFSAPGGSWEVAVNWRKDYPELPNQPSPAEVFVKASVFRDGDFQFAVTAVSRQSSELEEKKRAVANEAKTRAAAGDWQTGQEYGLRSPSNGADSYEPFLEIDRIKEQLDAHRPLDAKQIAAVEEKLRLDWTYNSNAIEGNPLSLGETSFFLREGLTSKGKPLSAFLEAQNHMEAIEHLRSVIDGQRELTERVIKDLHAILFKGIEVIHIGPAGAQVTKDARAGAYKLENNHVIKRDGSIHWYVDALQTPGEMEGLLAWYHSERHNLHPVELAARFHHRLAAIHPFNDGNGRVSRLAMNLILMQSGYSPAIIRVDDREQYYAALEDADAGRHGPFISLVEREVTNTLQLMLDVVEGREAFDMDDLGRLLGNVASNIRAVESELGRHARALGELRAELFGVVGQHVQVALNEHLSTGAGSTLPFAISQASGVPPIESSIMQKAAGSVQSQHFPTLQISSNKRIIPLSAVGFGITASKYNAQIYGSYAFADLDERGNDAWMGAAVTIDGPKGSIYAEDWHEHDVKSFVIEVLKRFYGDFERQVARRRDLVTTEELEPQ